jgi:SOS regulatory protein LexA
MSEKKQQLFKYLVENSFESPPSVRELCEALDVKSTSSMHRMLHELEQEGVITIARGKRRNISLAKDSNAVSVPLLGTVAAGLPILAHESIEGYVSFDSPHKDNSNLFALRVRGDSMINAGILDGDIIIARQTQTARNGEIIVALLGDEATCKRFYLTPDGVELRAENPDYAPIVSTEVAVLGKVIANFRYYE